MVVKVGLMQADTHESFQVVVWWKNNWMHVQCFEIVQPLLYQCELHGPIIQYDFNGSKQSLLIPIRTFMFPVTII